jgi:hypothetical protein
MEIVLFTGMSNPPPNAIANASAVGDFEIGHPSGNGWHIFLKGIRVNVCVRCAKQNMTEWLEIVRTHFELRAEQICEQISLNFPA